MQVLWSCEKNVCRGGAEVRTVTLLVQWLWWLLPAVPSRGRGRSFPSTGKSVTPKTKATRNIKLRQFKEKSIPTAFKLAVQNRSLRLHNNVHS